VMLPLKDKDKPVVQKLLSAGCCARCVLRFCCVSVQAETLKELHCFIGDTTDSGAAKSTEENKDEPAEDPPSKRPKLEPSLTGAELDQGSTAEKLKDEESQVCVVCLGILQELCDKNQAIKIVEAVKGENYEFDTLVLSVSLPAQLCVREHSCWLHVKTQLREKSIILGKDDVIQVKEAFKWIMQSLVAKELGGVAVSPFEVGVEFTHPETDADCHFLYVSNSSNIFTPGLFFLSHYPCPPIQTTTRCSAQDVQCLHTSVFVAGRYNKFCRSLPQTPWVIDGERRMESSVEELIATPIVSAFRAQGFNFSSSGREDVDVRTLGNGRPFAMELLNPHRSRFNRVQMKQLQETINNSSDKIRVRDLQVVTREAMSRMKEGEEEKTKSYTALIWTQKPICSEDITFIDGIKDLTLEQKTPLRVLHRRVLAVRPRVIHSMTTRFLDPHHFYLGLKTQAGTYIKEFVHGDFGRTKPNLCQLLKTETDILELDVEVGWKPLI
uniref:tRNA pseudouridine(55) synthase n=1 Tax=Sphaeramia orbicularis TaxID=375764 RepID=A0A672YZT3_9TELE